MDKAITELHQILQRLIGLHRQLLDITRREKTALLEMNLKEVQENTFDKEATLYSVHQAETERQRKISEIAILTKTPVEELTIQKLVIQVQGSDIKMAEQLRTTANALTVLIDRIKDQNKENSRLVEQSLIHIREMKRNVLGESQRGSETYGAKGQKVTPSSESRLLKGEA